MLAVVGFLALSAVPDGDPIRTLKLNGAHYDVYLVEREGVQSIRVCGRYMPTGTRIRRNTCGGPTPDVRVQVAPALPNGFFNPNIRRGDVVAKTIAMAQRLEIRANEWLVGQVDIVDVLDDQGR
ncbi:MAG: hypothetical protein AAGJ56_04645 [Myxococcota bacterium]